MSQSRTRRSTPALASVKPSGANATDETPCECPRKVRTSRAPAVQSSSESIGPVGAVAAAEGCAGTVEEALGCVMGGSLAESLVVNQRWRQALFQNSRS